MDPAVILAAFIVLKAGQFLIERRLARLNRAYYRDPANQERARRALGIPPEDMEKTLNYSEDKFRLGMWQGWIETVIVLAFLALGGLGWVEQLARAADLGEIGSGLLFFGIVALLGMLMNLPFDWYRTFVLEERHGFNRQTPKGFVADRVKGIVIGAILGGLILAAILWIMEATGTSWWIWAWLAMSGFSVLTAWLYPTFLAPLFNKFRPVEAGELKDRIDALAKKVGFRTAGIFIMDASKRSSHGNAYFTGVFGKKRIVLFDTLVDSMSPSEVVAVLAHELGHFKLRHVRWHLIRGIAMTGLVFFVLSLCLPLSEFYEVFGLAGVSNYGALVVFGLWFGIVDFLLQPFENYLSRRNEFAADAFAAENLGTSSDLASALLKLREKSHVMPLSHPLFSKFYHSHPPLLERLEAMGRHTQPA